MASTTLKWNGYGSSTSVFRLAWWPVFPGSQELSLPEPWKSYPCTLAKSRYLKTWLRSQPAEIFTWSAGVNAVNSLWVPPSASSWRRNSASSSVRLALSFGLTWLPGCPSLPGHSQSRSMPSKTPAAEPGPPCPLYAGRLPLMYMSMQELTSFLRDASVAAASEKNFEYVQPPIDIRIFRFGNFAFRCLSWLKLPCNGWKPV